MTTPSYLLDSLDLDELRAFLAVADTGSFRAAAVALDVSRSTLRRRVDSLESRLGRRLLLRSPQGVLLTRAGNVLADGGRAVLANVESLLSGAR